LNYRLRHRTSYEYEDPVSVSHHVVRLTRRALSSQMRRWSEISIVSKPAVVSSQTDYFGNVATFSLEEPHDRLIVEANIEAEVALHTPPDFAASPRWEFMRDNLASDYSDEGLDAYQFVFDSRRVDICEPTPTRPAACGGRRRLACLVFRLASRHRLGGFRSNQ
jgi:transglutaminase-like putative cysteine protease